MHYLNIVNDKLYNALDTVIKYEQYRYCIDKNDTLIFLVRFRKKDNYEYVGISLIEHYGQIWELPRGFFYYKSHLFFVYNKKTNLIKKKCKKKSFYFYDFKKTEKEEYLLACPLDIIDWGFRYDKKAFRFEFVQDYRIWRNTSDTILQFQEINPDDNYNEYR